MKILFILILFPAATFGQYPLITSNWDFQEKQQLKMRRLGFQKIESHLIGKYSGKGQIFKSEKTWESFDSLGRFIKRGFENDGKDTLTFERYYSKSGKYLGETHFAKETKQFGLGRIYIYDTKDSLIEIRRRDSQQIITKFEYINIDDSITLVKHYNDPLAQGLKCVGTTKVIRTDLKIVKQYMRDDSVHAEEIYEYNTNGTLKYKSTKESSSLQEEFYEYDQKGKLISKEIKMRESLNHKINFRKVLWKFDSNGDLIKHELFENEKIKEKLEYKFSNKLLLQQINTVFYPGWAEVYTFTFTYNKNGLMRTCSQQLNHPTKVSYTYTFSYE